MPLITFFINRILEKEKIDKNIILSYQCLNTIDNLDNDVKSYYYLQTNVECGIIDNSEKLLDYYLDAKKISNGFTKLVRHYKWKKARIYSWDSDLYMINKLDDLKNHHVVSILSNKTIYRFKISDIINIWSESLLTRQGLFSTPQHPKNPHTNQTFKIHNLYNLYFGICDSRYHIPLDISAVFRVDFNLPKFKRYYLPLLRERIIELYFKEASNYELYEYIMTMLKKLKDEIGDVFIPHYPSYLEQSDIVNRMKKYVLMFLRATLSCNPVIKNENIEKLNRTLKEFVDSRENEDIIYRIRTRRRSSSMLNSISYSSLPPSSNSTETTSIPTPTPPPQRIRLPRIEEPPGRNTITRRSFVSDTTTTMSHIRNRITRYSTRESNRNSLGNRLSFNVGESQAFRPRNEIPRSPTNINVTRDSVVSTYENSNIYSGSLRNRLRFG